MKKLFSIAACVALLVSPVVAQQRGQRQPRGFGQRGTNSGQRMRLRDPMVAALDADGDGALSEQELANATARLRKLDQNGNGSIDRDELRAAMRSAMGAGRLGGPGGSRGGGSTTLERSGLKLGQQMPNVSIFDAEGERFRFADAKGKYAVVVFGCLT